MWEINDSLKIFKNMKTHDRITWNTIITECVQYGDFTLGLRMINQMRTEGVEPDVATVLLVGRATIVENNCGGAIIDFNQLLHNHNWLKHLRHWRGELSYKLSSSHPHFFTPSQNKIEKISF